MRRHPLNIEKRNNYNLFIVGCGFIIILMIAFYMTNYISPNRQSRDLDYSELVKKHKFIEEEFAYELVNELIFSDSALVDSMEFVKINAFSIPHSKEMKRFIKSFPDSVLNRNDKRYMTKQLSKKKLLWDKSKLNYCWILTSNDLNKINESDSTDYWEEYRKLFGKHGHHRYSKPVFNKDKTFAIIEYGSQRDWLVGGGGIYAYRKINGKWTYYTLMFLWIS
jgi:hypothetical protein